MHHDDTAHLRGLRNVALLEITKGVVVLIAALALAALLHRDLDLQSVALSILDFLHIDPDRKFAALFVNGAERVMDLNVMAVLGVAAAYSALRFTEGYGLWRTRVWAEWLALFSGAIYLPLEITELVKKASVLRWTFLITNLIVLAYIAYIRVGAMRRRAQIPED